MHSLMCKRVYAKHANDALQALQFATSDEHHLQVPPAVDLVVLFCCCLFRNVFRFRTTNNNQITHRRTHEYFPAFDLSDVIDILISKSSLTLRNFGTAESTIRQHATSAIFRESNIAIASFKSYLRIPYQFIRADIHVSGIP